MQHGSNQIDMGKLRPPHQASRPRYCIRWEDESDEDQTKPLNGQDDVLCPSPSGVVLAKPFPIQGPTTIPMEIIMTLMP